MSYKSLIAMCFLMNGLGMIGLKTVSEIKHDAAIPIASLFLYMTALLPALIHANADRKPLEPKSIWIGVMGGIGSAVATVTSGRAAGLIAGYIVFPVSSGGTLLMMVVTSRLLFKEKIGPYGLAGIAVSVIAIVLLSS
jgi:drug/metabolite transporter (DMT)-like permease